MSHYAVVVFAEDGDFDGLLAPYNEADEKYKVFVPKPYEQIEEEFNRFKLNNPDWTMEMYLDQYSHEDGEWGYRENPQGYWDWYTLDGKDYLFELKDGAKPDDRGDYHKADYLWEEDDEVLAESAGQFWDRYIATAKNGDPPSLYRREYYLERYKTKEQYMQECSKTVPYAFITPDGKWHAPGRVGWFGMSDENAEDWNRYEKEWHAYLKTGDNPCVSIVDCHI